MATGGGAYKYYDRMKEVLEVEVLREDEMECLIIGRLLTQSSRGESLFLTYLRPRFLHYGDSPGGLYVQRV